MPEQIKSGWVGVDLDGTLAEYHGWSEKIGKPIEAMVNRVIDHINAGDEVRIFTARVWYPEGDAEREKQAKEQAFAIQTWCFENIGVELPITCVKDYGMIYCYDDRAKQVIPNTGVLLEEICHGLPEKVEV